METMKIMLEMANHLFSRFIFQYLSSFKIMSLFYLNIEEPFRDSNYIFQIK